jgi:predicted Zn-dependent peptidase
MTKTLLLGGLASLTLLAGPVSAVERWVLPNGVRVLVRPDPEAAVVAASLQVRAGSRFETPEVAGITHLLHRAMLRGTTRRTAEALVDAVERMGGSLDASGDVESAEVRGTALARHWHTLLALMAEVALTPALLPAEVDKERRQLLGQLRARADAPFTFALDALLNDLYGPHPYAWPPLGRAESVARLDAEALRAHHRAVYRADRLVLAVSGGVDPHAVRGAASRLFGRLGSGPGMDLPVAPAPSPLGSRRSVDRPAQQAQVLVGVLGPPLGDPDFPRVRVLAAWLGGGMGSRLYTEVRDRRGLAYAVGMLYPWRTESAPLVAYAGSAPDRAETVEAVVRAELARATEVPPEPDELARARAWSLGTLAMDRRTNARHAWYLAFFEVIGAGWDFPDRYARAVAAVSAQEVQAVARRYLGRPTVLRLEPR